MTKPIFVEFFVEIYETKKVSDNGEHALPNMVSDKLGSALLSGLKYGAS